MNVKNIFSTVGEWMGGLVELFTGFVCLGVLSEVIFGTGIFGVNVVSNLTAIVGTFGNNGFAGLLALLILVGLYNKK
mgnify:CR=1 FL=1|tara:strand:+ start:1128 stop:1358 length:231 start_codon:yes stop_codon:yes gene_type:complete